MGGPIALPSPYSRTAGRNSTTRQKNFRGRFRTRWVQTRLRHPILRFHTRAGRHTQLFDWRIAESKACPQLFSFINYRAIVICDASPLEGRNKVENRNGACVMGVASLGSREKGIYRLLTEPGLNTSQVESDKKLVADFLNPTAPRCTYGSKFRRALV